MCYEIPVEKLYGRSIFNYAVLTDYECPIKGKKGLGWVSVTLRKDEPLEKPHVFCMMCEREHDLDKTYYVNPEVFYLLPATDDDGEVWDYPQVVMDEFISMVYHMIIEGCNDAMIERIVDSLVRVLMAEGSSVAIECDGERIMRVYANGYVYLER